MFEKGPCSESGIAPTRGWVVLPTRAKDSSLS
jgi:hypothetical protein